MNIVKIDSPKNSRIKLFSKLKERKWRKETGLFIVEGEREINRALQCNLVPEAIIVEESLGDKVKAYELKALEIKVRDFLIISQRCSEEISIREKSPGIFAVFRYPESKDINSARIRKDSICLCLLGIEKPGNIGAILRTVDAFGVDIVLLSKNTDIFNPHIIRNSAGTVFNINVYQVSEDEAADFITKFYVISADPNAKDIIWNIKIRFPVCIVLGSEDKGVPQRFLNISDTKVKIPMFGIADSLNVSVAAGIVIYEILRNKVNQSKNMS